MKREPIPHGRYGWCWHCKQNVQSVTIDEGFDHEFGFHSLPTDVCPECRERVSEPKDEPMEEDMAADFEDAKEAAAREVTFDDVIDEMTELEPAKKAYLMAALNKDRSHFAYQIEGVFADAIEKIAKRRAHLAAGA